MLVGTRMELNVSSKADVEKRESRSNASGNYTAEFPVLGKRNGNFKTGTILTSKAGYKKTKGNEGSGEWEEIDQVFGTNPFLIDVNFFKKLNVELKGEEVIRGNETYVLSLSGDPKPLAESLAKKFEDMDKSYVNALGSFEAQEDEGESVTRPEIILWIDKESFIPLKKSYYLAAGPGEKDKDEISPIISARSETFYNDLNKSTQIQIPEVLDTNSSSFRLEPKSINLVATT